MINDNIKIRLVYALLISYMVVIFLATVIYHYYINPGEADITRAAIRIISCLLLMYGLFKKKSWAYWITRIGASMLSIIGSISIITLLVFSDYLNGQWFIVTQITILTALCIGESMLLRQKETKNFFLSKNNQISQP